MNPNALDKLQEEITDLLRKHNLDGFTGMAFKRGVPAGAVCIYDPTDFCTRVVVLAMADKLERLFREIPGARINVNTGFSQFPEDKN